jgi:hypothetical protein
MQATWYFWHSADPNLDPEMVQEMMGEYDGWERCFLPDPTVMDLRHAVLGRWRDLADDVYPIDPAGFPPGFDPNGPDAPPDLLERVLWVNLRSDHMDRERELVEMAKSRGLSCSEHYTDRTDVQ